jgi:DNA-binding response OmpR family regulator
METSKNYTAIPRVALLMSQAPLASELEEILKGTYSSLLVITDRSKLLEFDIGFLIIVDTIPELLGVQTLSLPPDTFILLTVPGSDSELEAVGFASGASDVISHPFDKEEILNKTEKYLEKFRQTA